MTRDPANHLSSASLSNLQIAVLTVLRIAIGWHLLYEGIAKLLTPGWTAAGFLSTSRWWFAGLFNRMAANPEVMKIVDILNIWGLILIGLGLVLGIFIKSASRTAIILLVLYYVAHPPFIGMNVGMPTEGHYLVVNKTLIEIIALVLISIFPSGSYFRLDKYIIRHIKSQPKPVSKTNPEIVASGKDTRPPKNEYGGEFQIKRRELIKNLALLPVVGGLFYGSYKKYRWDQVNAITGATIKVSNSKLQDIKGEIPTGRLGHLEVSRLTLGCNLIGGWSHSRDLIYVSSLFKAYNTERKIFETIELAEQAGINMMNVVSQHFPIVNKYLNITGGKMQTFCQVRSHYDDMKTDIDKAIDGGTTTMYIQGGDCDRMVHDGRIDFLAEALEYMKSQGYLAGIGAHSIQVPIACEQAGLNPDYYVKTLHHDNYWSAHPRENRTEFSVDRKRYSDHNMYHDNMFDLFPEQTIDFMATQNKPWIAFKVLAGGAIRPEDGFHYAFKNGADFICVGMFDFQIVDDVNTAIDVLSNIKNRQRPWIA
jgi:uncharacterized membrane protein YphA (DoxX/SURF4 family)